jgi:DNA repair protein RecO (recombination protein O)
MRVILQPAFVLHARPFRDTSLLIDLFTLNHGIIGVIAKGARGPKSKLRGLLLPFVPLLVSWSGKTDLYSLGKAETCQINYNLTGNRLISGFYLNELLIKLLHRHDPHPNLFSTYQKTLTALNQSSNIQIALRLFEKQLLSEIGYGLTLTKDLNNQEIINHETYYYLHEQGFVRSHEEQQQLVSGNSLLALHSGQFNDATALREVKILLRAIITKLLDRPLKTPELLQ